MGRVHCSLSPSWNEIVRISMKKQKKNHKNELQGQKRKNNILFIPTYMKNTLDISYRFLANENIS